ncbi:MAG: hypothetical protein H7Z10_02220 [Gemmatimonadaceae bacterium]|nr:hypothetical protein [Acetobacteraceae bacterium]
MCWTSYAPGYIDRAHEVIVGLQIERPFRRSVLPSGGLKIMEVGATAAGFTPEIMACRRSAR